MDINEQADALKMYLKTLLPQAVITRDLSLFNNHSGEIGGKPVFTLVIGSGRAKGLGSFARAPMDAGILLLLVQQNLTGEDYTGEQIEQTELGFRKQVREALASPSAPQAISGAIVENWVTSGQQNPERAEILMNIRIQEH